MKILVLLKETFAAGSRIVLVSPTEIDDRDISYSINPYDEHALEEAIRIKEKHGGEITVFLAAREQAAASLRDALALGADRAILLVADITGRKDSLITSKILVDAIKEEGDFDLILSGWTDIDEKNAQVPGRLSESLQIPFINIVTEIMEIKCLERKITCRREGDGCDEIIEAEMPALISVQKNINEPRYPKVQDILEAGKKKIELRRINTAEEDDGIAIRYELVGKKRARIRFDSSDPKKTARELVEKLMEAKVL